MGGCLSLDSSSSRRRRRRNRRDFNGSRSSRGRHSTGDVREIHTQPLKPIKPKWKSDIPITEGQLLSKRDEFWETAPAFDGRKEIWDALKAATSAVETGDHSLAQAIIDGANILLPHGTLTECYDELGNRYQLPVYVLSSPVNLIEDLSRDSDSLSNITVTKPGGKDIVIGIRLSTGKEIQLSVNTGESFYQLKRRIYELEGIEPSRQRFLFCGHLLVDRDRLSSVKIPKGFLLQVMVVQFDSPSLCENSKSLVNNMPTTVISSSKCTSFQHENGAAAEGVKIQLIEDQTCDEGNESATFSDSESNAVYDNRKELEESGPL